MQDEDVDAVFNTILCHSEHRLAFYSQIISRELKQVPRQPAEDYPNDYKERFRPSDPRHWEGLVIKPPLDQKQDDGASEIVSDCLSDIEGQTLVATVLGEIEGLFGTSDEDRSQVTAKEPRLRQFLKNFYAIIKHPKQRPAVKNYLRFRLLKGEEAIFLRVWGALLFMCRTFHAAVVLVDLAAKTKAFSAVRFLHAPDNPRAGNSETPLFKRPIKVVKQFGLEPNRAWARHFQSRNVVKRYKELLPMQITVHAETQLIYFTEGQGSVAGTASGSIFPYIGCSKKCCFFCDRLVSNHAVFSARGTHETV
jgi:hypothetical protein